MYHETLRLTCQIVRCISLYSQYSHGFVLRGFTWLCNVNNVCTSQATHLRFVCVLTVVCSTACGLVFWLCILLALLAPRLQVTLLTAHGLSREVVTSMALNELEKGILSLLRLITAVDIKKGGASEGVSNALACCLA